MMIVTFRDALLSYITSGNDLQVLGSLSVMATLLQTKGFCTAIKACIAIDFCCH